jgi:hypothetical protein
MGAAEFAPAHAALSDGRWRAFVARSSAAVAMWVDFLFDADAERALVSIASLRASSFVCELLTKRARVLHVQHEPYQHGHDNSARMR